jgi:beta-lactamase class A
MFLITCLLALLASRPVCTEDLDRRVRSAIEGFRGEVSLYAKNLDTGAACGVRENERVRTASTIKLPVMAAVFAAVARSQAGWTDASVLRQQDKVPGSGVLREFSAGLRVPLIDLVRLMIVVSDNTATNLVLDHVSADAVNAYMDTLGLRQTRVLRKIMGTGGAPAGVSAAGRVPDNLRFGLGVSTPREMVLLLERIEHLKDRTMIEILKRQQYKDGIGRRMKHPVASKSGALDHLRSDVGIVYAPAGRIAIAITVDRMPEVDWSADNAGNILIATLAGLLVEDGLRQ